MLVSAMIVAALAQVSEPSPLKVLWTVPLKSHCFGGGAVADVNGDGFPDVAFCTYFGDSRVMVLSGRDGSTIWEYSDGNHCYDASCKFADVNGDGKLELIAPNSSGCRVLCFDAATGSVVWNTFLGQAECTDTPPWIGDADGDKATDIVVGTFKSKLFVLKGKDGAIARTLEVTPHPSGAAVQSCPLVLDLNSDGVKDFVACTFGKAAPGVYAVNGKDGSRLWRVETGDSIYHGPVLTFGGCTAEPGLQVGDYDGGMYSIAARATETGVLHSSRSDSGERYIMSPVGVLGSVPGKSPVPPDLRNFVACEHITRFDFNNKQTWQVPIRGEGRGPNEWVTRGLSIADLSGDGHPDLAYLTSRGYFRVIDERDGKPLFEFDGAGVLPAGQKASDGSHSPVLADFNGDGKLDAFFVVGGGERKADGTHTERYGVAVCITGFAGKATHENGWYMFRHDLENTGNPTTAIDANVARHIPVK